MAEKIRETPMEPLLSVNNIEVIYHNVILVLKGMSLSVDEGRIVAVLGNNGAGKTTTLKAISGLLKSEDGAVTDGQIQFKGERIDRKYPEEIVRKGIFQVMEGRRVFEDLSIEENLIAGGHTNGSRRKMKEDIQKVYGMFPRLKARKNVLAGYISGGEQQMLVIGRGLMSIPTLMLLDEPSMGLSPLLVSEIFKIIQRINQEEKVSILLVEQNARLALSIASHGYVMENGRIVLDDSVDKLKENADVREFYLGLTEVGKKKSYRDVKHYRRRKRWLT
jgi:branched-chain amino acid transport system ATP-binding protein